MCDGLLMIIYYMFLWLYDCVSDVRVVIEA